MTESLANAVRHAGPAQVAVTIAACRARSASRSSTTGGARIVAPLSGLSNLRQRAEARGGEFEIDEATGGGTRVSSVVPT